MIEKGNNGKGEIVEQVCKEKGHHMVEWPKGNYYKLMGHASLVIAMSGAYRFL